MHNCVTNYPKNTSYSINKLGKSQTSQFSPPFFPQTYPLTCKQRCERQDLDRLPGWKIAATVDSRFPKKETNRLCSKPVLFFAQWWIFTTTLIPVQFHPARLDFPLFFRAGINISRDQEFISRVTVFIVTHCFRFKIAILMFRLYFATKREKFMNNFSSRLYFFLGKSRQWN